MKKLAILFALVAALAVSAPLVAQARHSADDPRVELRHRADDRVGDDRAKSKARVASTSTQRGGADDPAGDDHGGHGRGGDDGPGHH